MRDDDAATLGLGPEVGDTKACSRMLAVGGLCGVAAFMHAAVTVAADNVSACHGHWPEMLESLQPLQWHRIAEDCGVPGSTWNFDENRCEFDPFSQLEETVAVGAGLSDTRRREP